MELDDLVERWLNGQWPYRRLEDVVREHTAWSAQEYDEWVTFSRISDDPSERVR